VKELSFVDVNVRYKQMYLTYGPDANDQRLQVAVARFEPCFLLSINWFIVVEISIDCGGELMHPHLIATHKFAQFVQMLVQAHVPIVTRNIWGWIFRIER
jgi:hypothetical protein